MEIFLKLKNKHGCMIQSRQYPRRPCVLTYRTDLCITLLNGQLKDKVLVFLKKIHAINTSCVSVDFWVDGHSGLSVVVVYYHSPLSLCPNIIRGVLSLYNSANFSAHHLMGFGDSLVSLSAVLFLRSVS